MRSAQPYHEKLDGHFGLPTQNVMLHVRWRASVPSNTHLPPSQVDVALAQTSVKNSDTKGGHTASG